MKKQYETPKLEVIKMEFNDVIVASGCVEHMDEGKHKGWDKGNAWWKEHNKECWK